MLFTILLSTSHPSLSPSINPVLIMVSSAIVVCINMIICLCLESSDQVYGTLSKLNEEANN